MTNPTINIDHILSDPESQIEIHPGWHLTLNVDVEFDQDKKATVIVVTEDGDIYTALAAIMKVSSPPFLNRLYQDADQRTDGP